ncbi:Short-chain-fatty-acid--CoA ligase [Kocuria varians]|uniref:Short-chain-fatty-acid--CoA ligase n=1 Tax=Kocuria varians TaxID=1272 RepID=A0A7D7Q2Q0_KOCVA|nr:Short-chain-fatty-acid--CoA ligase [Kocuria varians]
MDQDGYAQITGRIEDMVIRGGENIYPREVEEFLCTHPDIVDAQVIGGPSEKYGEELMAWLRLRDGAPALTAEVILEFADGKISRHKIPRYVHVVDEFPMTVTGKVRKVEMREEALKLLDLERCEHQSFVYKWKCVRSNCTNSDHCAPGARHDDHRRTGQHLGTDRAGGASPGTARHEPGSS